MAELEPPPLAVEVGQGDEEIGQRRVFAVQQLGEALREVARVVHEEIFSCVFGASPDTPGGLMERLREARGRVWPAPTLACSGGRLAQREGLPSASGCGASYFVRIRVKENPAL